MKLLLITPYYPYPAEKTGGVHTINMILNNLSNYEIDIFYYGEDENKNYKFNNQIKNVYYEDLRNKKKYSRLKSLLIGKTYSSYMYNKDSDVLNSILSSNIYDVIIYDQYSSMDFNIKTNTSKCNYLFMHDSYPMLFERKGKMANIVGRIYYKLQYIYSIKEEENNYTKFDKIFFVSSKDISNEKNMHSKISDRFYLCNIGIDINEVLKAPELKLKGKSLVFTGVMDYEPNEDAMVYFIQEVFDKVAKKCPEVTLYIVGKNPTDKLKKLVKNRKNIIVTGKVDSVFSYIKSSTIYISPLRIGSGKKNKIIEAISCGTPLIASTVSMEGFEDIEDKNLILRADSSNEWVENICKLLSDEEKRIDIKKRMLNLLDESYSWKNIAKKLVE